MTKKVLVALALLSLLACLVIVVVPSVKEEHNHIEIVKNSPSIAEFGYDIADIPLPKVNEGNWISNPDAIIEQYYIDSINSAINNLNSESTVQFAVVAINKINACDIDTFASNLFNYWGIGYADVSNGTLILLDKEDKKIIIRTGYGTEKVLTDSICASVIKNEMIPCFIEENYSKGIFDGINAMIEEINQSPNKQILVSKLVIK